MLKRVWKFTERKEFVYEYFFPGLAIIFFLMTAAHLQIQFIDANDLVLEEGIVSYMNQELVQGPGSKSYPLKIRLKESHRDYELIYHFKDQFPFIRTAVNTGDTVIIYTSPSIFNLARLSSDDVIYQLDKERQTVFSLNDMKSFKLDQIKHFLFLAVFSLLLSFIMKRLVKKRDTKVKSR